MLPLIPFALGLLTGAATVRALKSAPVRTGLDKAKASLGKTQEHLREAAVSSLNAIESSSARARSRLSGHPEAATTAEPPVPAPAAEAAPVKRRRAAATPRKRTPKAETGGKGKAS